MRLHSLVSQPTKNGPPLYWICGKDSYALVVVKRSAAAMPALGATFRTCHLFRNARAGTPMFLARFGEGAGGATASCADESRSARPPGGDSVVTGGAVAFTQGATLKHPGWRDDRPSPSHCGCSRQQPARKSKSAQAIACPGHFSCQCSNM